MWGTFRWSGLTWVCAAWWASLGSAERWCHCKATLNYLRKVVVIVGGFQGPEESKSHSYLWVGKKNLRNCRLVNITSVPEHMLLKTISKHIMGKQVIQLVWIYALWFNRSDRLLQPDSDNSVWEENSGCCLPQHQKGIPIISSKTNWHTA